MKRLDEIVSGLPVIESDPLADLLRAYRDAQKPDDELTVEEMWDAAKGCFQMEAQESVIALYNHLFRDPKAALDNNALEPMRYSLLSTCAEFGTIDGFQAALIDGCRECLTDRATYLFACLVGPLKGDPIH